MNTLVDLTEEQLVNIFDSLEHELEFNFSYESYSYSNNPIIRELYKRLSNREISIFEFYRQIFNIQKKQK